MVSIDYLTKPLEVVKEIGRVLRPGGEAIISISNRYVILMREPAKKYILQSHMSSFIVRIRCFPTKAMQIWLQTSDLEHIFIVGSFFHYAGGFDPPQCTDASPNPGRSDPLFIVTAKKGSA